MEDRLYVICDLKFKNNRTLKVEAEIRYGNSTSKGGYAKCFKLVSHSGFGDDKYPIRTFDNERIMFGFSPSHNTFGTCEEVAFYILDMERELAYKHSGQFRLCRTCIHSVVTDSNEIEVIQNNYPNYLEKCYCGRYRSRKKEEGYLPKKSRLMDMK